MTTTLALLYVDDEPDIRTIAELALQLDPTIDVRTAGSARDALSILESGWRPDVVVLDVMMPDIDGPALADRIRARPGFADVPIIFMTARARSVDIAGYQDRGAKGVIVKPFDPISLAGEIRAILERG